MYALAIVIAAGAAVSGVLIAASHSSSGAHHHGTVYNALFASGAALVVAALTAWMLRRQLNRPAMKELLGFSFSQRRAAARAVNSGTTLTGEHRDIARAQFEQLGSMSSRLRWIVPLAVILFVAVAIGNVGGLRWLWVAIAALELLATGASLLLYRRQRHRIERALSSQR
jgi:hypothetical protein